MIHEVMILDHSGFDLALVNIGTALKFAMYGLLITNFLVPANPGRIIAGGENLLTSHELPVITGSSPSWMVLVQVGVFFMIQVLFASLIGLMESFRARKKLARNPQFIVTLSSIALVAFILVLLITYKMIS